MNMKFCFIPAEKSGDDGKNVGYRYVKAHEAEWVTSPSSEGQARLVEYLTVGYMRGSDFVIKDGKAYTIKKSFIDLASDTIVFACLESVQGCDLIN